jgi:hypothetical protein
MLNHNFFIVRLIKYQQKPPVLPVLQTAFSQRKTESQAANMNTIARLDQWIEFARSRGFEIRFDWFAGNGGGACEVNGRKVLFIDLALPPIEQLELVRRALGNKSSRPSDQAA